MSEITLPDWSEHICLFFDDYRYIAIHGGRGSSKSHTIARIIVLRAAKQPTRILCAREVQKSIKDSVKRLLDDVIDNMGMRPMFESTDKEIRGRNGSLIVFAGLQHNVDSIKSMEGIDICWCEEAQTISANSLKVLIPTIRNPSSCIIFTWNPDDPKDPVDAMFRGEQAPPRSYVREVNWKENPWFPEPLREDMEHQKEIDYGEYLHIWEGQYRQRNNANVFQNWRVEDFETPSDAFFRFGADWGYSVDPTVLVRCYVDGRKLYIDQEAYQVGCEIDDTPALFATVDESERWPIIADSASPERISYMRKNGYPKMMKAKKGAKSIEEGIEFLRSMQIVVHPRCENAIYELSHYRYKIDPQTDEITNILEDKNNHCIAEGEPVLTMDGWKPIEEVYPDDYVMTRDGWKPVEFNGVMGRDREIVEIVMQSGSTVRCTPDHKILTSNGWLKAESLRYNDEVYELEFDPCHSQNIENLTGISTDVIQSRIVEKTGFIFHALTVVERLCFTGIFGLFIMGLFQKGTTYTTQISTLLITILATWFVSLLASTLKCILPKTQSADVSNRTGWMKLDISRRFGMQQKKAESGIASMVKRLGRLFLSDKRIVRTVVLNLATKAFRSQDSARTIASQLGAEKQGWITLQLPASSVDQNLRKISTVRVRLAQGRVATVRSIEKRATVYDLSVKDKHEFVCNLIVVSNCIDALRYSQEAVRRTLKAKEKPVFTPMPSVNHW